MLGWPSKKEAARRPPLVAIALLLGALNERPGNSLAPVGGHDVRLRDRCGRARRADHLPDPALGAAFSSTCSASDRHGFSSPRH